MVWKLKFCSNWELQRFSSKWKLEFCLANSSLSQTESFQRFIKVFTLKWKLEFWFQNSSFDHIESLRFFNILKTQVLILKLKFWCFGLAQNFFIKSPKLEFWWKTRVLRFAQILVQKLKTWLCSLKSENSSLGFEIRVLT